MPVKEVRGVEYQMDGRETALLLLCGAVAGGVAAREAIVALAVFVFGAPVVFGLWIGWRERSAGAGIDVGKQVSLGMVGLTFLFREVWHLVGWAWAQIATWGGA